MLSSHVIGYSRVIQTEEKIIPSFFLLKLDGMKWQKNFAHFVAKYITRLPGKAALLSHAGRVNKAGQGYFSISTPSDTPLGFPTSLVDFTPLVFAK